MAGQSSDSLSERPARQGTRNAVAKLKKNLKGSVSQTRKWLFGTAGSLAAITLSWWWMIEDARAPRELPRAAFGQQLEVGRVWLTPLELSHKDGLLILEAEAENPTGETQTLPFGLPDRLPRLVDGARSLPAAEVILRRDEAPLLALQPRLRERLRFLWRLDAPPQSGAVIRFSKQTFKLQDNLYGQASWLGFTAVAELPIASGALR